MAAVLDSWSSRVVASLNDMISIALVTDGVAPSSYNFSFERLSEHEKVILSLIACSKNSEGGGGNLHSAARSLIVIT